MNSVPREWYRHSNGGTGQGLGFQRQRLLPRTGNGLRKDSGHISRGQAGMWELEQWVGLGALLSRLTGPVGHTASSEVWVVAAADSRHSH